MVKNMKKLANLRTWKSMLIMPWLIWPMQLLTPHNRWLIFSFNSSLTVSKDWWWSEDADGGHQQHVEESEGDECGAGHQEWEEEQSHHLRAPRAQDHGVEKHQDRGRPQQQVEESQVQVQETSSGLQCAGSCWSPGTQEWSWSQHQESQCGWVTSWTQIFYDQIFSVFQDLTHLTATPSGKLYQTFQPKCQGLVGEIKYFLVVEVSQWCLLVSVKAGKVWEHWREERCQRLSREDSLLHLPRTR